MNDWDKNIPNLDVVDDYRSERKEVQACRGKHTPFSFGDVRNYIDDNWFHCHMHLCCFLVYRQDSARWHR